MTAIDLHTHSNRSDGTCAPAELIELAVQKGLSAVALTDHDTVDGLDEFLTAAANSPIEGIPGIEFSTVHEDKDVHLVGLFLQGKPEGLLPFLEKCNQDRVGRNLKMCQLLQQEGVDISLQRLEEENPGAVITRAHFGRYLMTYGYVKSINDAFDKFIGDRAKCYVPRQDIAPETAIAQVLANGGIPILAHPPLYRMSDRRLEGLVARLKEAGLVGIETVYSTYNQAESRDMMRLAKKYDLLMSGGSDFHGTNKPDIDLGTGKGHLFVPDEFLSRMKQAL